MGPSSDTLHVAFLSVLSFFFRIRLHLNFPPEFHFENPLVCNGGGGVSACKDGSRGKREKLQRSTHIPKGGGKGRLQAQPAAPAPQKRAAPIPRLPGDPGEKNFLSPAKRILPSLSC